MCSWVVWGWILIHVVTRPTLAWTLFPRSVSSNTDYDLVIIGAGASGLFASGAATMLGSKTLLIEQGSASSGIGTSLHDHNGLAHNNIGGDCTNAACVPSKAIRSVARRAIHAKQQVGTTTTPAATSEGSNWLARARSHATKTVLTVRNREDPQAMVERNPNLDIAIVSDCQFVSPQELSLTIEQWFQSKTSTKKCTTSTGHNNTSTATATTSPRTVRSKKFLLATGAAPMIPTKLEESAKAAGLCTYTYQTLLRPSTTTTTTSLNDSIWNWDPAKSRDKRIVIVGGGATACELAQSLVRLIGCQVDLVAPTLLRGDDVALANAAAQLLTREGVNLYLRCRVEDIGKDRRVQLSGPPTTLPPCDAMIFCTGRSPGPSLERLQVSKAQVQWNPTQGVLVRGKKNLQSISASRVYACGDCCSAVAPLARCATHAAWTGYYAALQSRLPRVLTWGAKLVHTTVPRVIYTDPELVSVGLSLEECVAKYGMNGFVRCHVSTKETDRSDMDGVVENENDEDTGTHVGFIELRATQVTGKILGMTACGPTAAELANEMSVILENGMRAMDVAKSLHSYPSHGYLLHRVALALALGNTWGLLEASGTIGKYLAWLGRKVSQLILWIQTRMRRSSALKAWEAEGVSKSFLSLSPSSWGTKTVGLSSFWDRFQSKKSSESIKGERTTTDDESPPNSDDNEWNEWFFRRPMGL